MPEGNTVWVTAQQLRRALVARVVTAADLRVPALATVDLSGRRVLDVAPRGKHLLIRFDGDPHLTLHTHLRMDGAWRTYPVSASGRDAAPGGTRAFDRADRIRVVLRNDDYVALGYRVHDIRLLPSAREDDVVGHLGPDLLGLDWDAARAVARLAAQPLRPIGEAILDQRNLAGIGNVYKAETCFLAGVSPWTPAGEVDLPALVDLAQRLLAANRERFDHITTGDSRPGRRTWVYGRAGRPCLRCGEPISVAWPGDAMRVTYWCRRCQPGVAPPPEPAGGRSPRLSRPQTPSPNAAGARARGDRAAGTA